MKVVIMTTVLSENYGAALQAYALKEVIESLGISANNYRYNDPLRILGSMSGIQKIKHKLWKMGVAVITGNRKSKRFTSFQENYLALTPKMFTSADQLRDNYGEYDVYIAGSDQIWNPDFFVYDTSYFLDFIPPEKRKISYASSFGKADFLCEEYSEKCGELLKQFKCVSVRERSGVDIVYKLCGKKAECVLDPTLLLTRDDWTKLVKTQKKEEDFILCYTMPGDKIVTRAIEKVAQKLSLTTGLPLKRIGNKEYDVLKFGRRSCDIEAGPEEFVNYFYRARYVVTNSFHGVAFSLNFGKDFFVPINNALRTNTALHERLLSVIELLRAYEAIINTSDITSGLDLKLHLIDHETVNERLQIERKKSLEFLKNAIGV